MGKKLKIISFETFRDCPEVTHTSIFKGNKLHPNGLFSEVIFGPVKDYTCQCGRLTGRQNAEKICPKCGVKVTSSDTRRTTFAKIELSPIDYVLVHPLYFSIFCKYAPLDSNTLKSILYKNKYIRLNDDKVEILATPDEHAVTGIPAIRLLMEYTASRDEEFARIVKEFGIDAMFTGVIPVYPPTVRPMLRKSNKMLVLHPINHLYLKLIQISKTLSTYLDTSSEAYQHACRLAQDIFNQVIQRSIGILTGKVGLIRRYMLGKRIDFSGRAVIAVNPELPLDTVEIPYKIAHMFDIIVLKNIIKQTKLSPLYLIKNRNTDKTVQNLYRRFLAELLTDYPVILNRQPTLHRQSIMAFKTKLIDGDVIRIPPLCTNPYNADFDGDQIAVYYPILPQTIKETQEKLMFGKNLVSPASGKLTPLVEQDVVLGLFELSRHQPIQFVGSLPFKEAIEMFKSTTEYTCYVEISDFNNMQVTLGWLKILSCLPEKVIRDGRFRSQFLGQMLDKKKILQMFELIYDILGEEALYVFDKLSKLSFNENNMTISLKDFDFIPERRTMEFFTNVFDNKHEEVIDKYKKQVQIDLFSGKMPNRAAMIVSSGTRGSWNQLRQITIGKGYVSDPQGRLIPTPIKSSFLEGLKKHEYFLSAYGGLKGLIDSATKTADSGYIARQLVYLLQRVRINREITDCGTDGYLEIKVTEDIAPLIVGRYYLNEQNQLRLIFDENSARQLLGKVIKLRSPIYCKSPDFTVCPICYGQLHKKLHSSTIGIIAAQSLAERTTQLTLRTFHTSGIAEAANLPDEFVLTNDFKLVAQKDVVFESISKYRLVDTDEIKTFDLHAFTFIDPPELHRVYQEGDVIGSIVPYTQDVTTDIKRLRTILNETVDSIQPLELLMKIFSLFKKISSAALVHYELLVSMLLLDSQTQDFYRYSKDYSKPAMKKSIKTIIHKTPSSALTFENFRKVLFDLLTKQDKVDTDEPFNQLFFGELDAFTILDHREDEEESYNLLENLEGDTEEMEGAYYELEERNNA